MVISGDLITDADLHQLADLHRVQDSSLTMLLKVSPTVIATSQGISLTDTALGMAAAPAQSGGEEKKSGGGKKGKGKGKGGGKQEKDVDKSTSSLSTAATASSFPAFPPPITPDPLDMFYVGFCEDDPSLPSFSTAASSSPFPPPLSATTASSSASASAIPSEISLTPFRIGYFRPLIDVEPSEPLELPKSLIIRFGLLH